MTLQEQLEIIQAAIDGKEIEFFLSIDKQWKTKNIKINPEFDFTCVKYRIKPEPKKEIKFHQYLIQNKIDNKYFASSRFYPNIESCQQEYNQYDRKVINKLPHTEIIVTED